jgi:hypothetical protein
MCWVSTSAALKELIFRLSPQNKSMAAVSTNSVLPRDRDGRYARVGGGARGSARTLDGTILNPLGAELVSLARANVRA